VDKKHFNDLINTVKKRPLKKFGFIAEGLECVEYQNNIFTSNLWVNTVKVGLTPLLIKQSERRGGDVILWAHNPTVDESKKIIEYLTSLSGLDLEIKYLSTSKSRLIPLPPQYWDNPKKDHTQGMESQQTQIHDKILEEIESLTKKPISILDLGCGDGTLLKKLSEKTPHELWGVELNKKIIIHAKKKLSKKASILYCNATELHLTLPRKNFEVITCIGLLDTQVTTLEETKKILQSIHKTLKLEGILIATPYTQPTYTTEEIEKTGFEILKKTIPKTLFTHHEPKHLLIAQKNTT